MDIKEVIKKLECEREPWGFYDLPEEVCRQIKYFVTKDREIYFVLPLDEESKWQNYGRNPGLVSVSRIKKCLDGRKVFYLNAFSPDDLDMTLEVHSGLRQEVIQFIRGYKVVGSYLDFFNNLKLRFNILSEIY